MNWTHEGFRQLEPTMARAWPSFEEVGYDGWVLRFADGYTKRANSINPHFESSLPLDEKIARCEAAYRAHGLPTVFRLTPFSQPDNLDEALAKAGYKAFDYSLVMAAPLAQGMPSSSSDVSHVAGDAWFAAFNTLRGLEHDKQVAHRRIVEASEGERCYALLSNKRGPCACGLGVLVDDAICLFDLFTAEVRRRQGHGVAIVSSILRWARDRGAQRGLLQVERENVAARRLYARLGFEDVYVYWYRVRM